MSAGTKKTSHEKWPGQLQGWSDDDFDALRGTK